MAKADGIVIALGGKPKGPPLGDDEDAAPESGASKSDKKAELRKSAVEDLAEAFGIDPSAVDTDKAATALRQFCQLDYGSGPADEEG